MKTKPFSVALGFAVAAVLIGLLPMPYGYYMLLRTVLCAVAAYAAFLQSNRASGLFWVLLALAVLYNPLIPVYLGQKQIWIIVNFATLAVLWRVHQLLPPKDAA